MKCRVEFTAIFREKPWSLVIVTFYSRQSLLLLEMWRSSISNSTAFELRTFSTDSKFDECFKRFANSWRKVFIWIFRMHRELRVHTDLFSFSHIQPITQTYSYWMCNVLNSTYMNT